MWNDQLLRIKNTITGEAGAQFHGHLATGVSDLIDELIDARETIESLEGRVRRIDSDLADECESIAQKLEELSDGDEVDIRDEVSELASQINAALVVC